MEKVLRIRNGHPKPRGTWMDDRGWLNSDWLDAGLTCPTSRDGADCM